MKINQLIQYSLAGTVLFLILLSGCEYKGPVSAWDELEKKEKLIPVIDSVIPEEAGTASEITIMGSHFSPLAENNWVYFDQTRCIIKSCNETSIVVYRPDVVGDSVMIKVSVTNAMSVAKFSPYKMEPVIESFGNFAGAEALVMGTVDQNENVYLAMLTNDIIRLDSEGGRDTDFIGTTSYNLWTDMKVGSDGNLYLARSNNVIYRLPVNGGEAEEFLRLGSRSDRITAIDFDENGNLFAGGKGSDLLVIRSETDYEKLGYYDDYEILGLRVYNGYVYVLAENSTFGIWRHQITDQNGSVGSQETVIDWNTGPYSDAMINDITFSADGVMVVATDNEEAPILLYDVNEGSYSMLFYQLIPSPVDKLVWGNSTYVYAIINRRTTFDNGGQLLRINMGEEGAPYYGRSY